MAEYIEDCDVYAASSYAVAVSHGHRVKQKVDLRARVDTETGEVTFYVPLDKIDTLRD